MAADSWSAPVCHPVLACADAVEAALKDVADVAVDFMPTPEKAAALVRLSRLGDQLEALRLRLVAAGDDVADAQGARDVAAWLAQVTLTERGPNGAAQYLARAIERRWHQLGAGLAQGRVNVAQAQVIAHALDELPLAELPEDLVAQAEAHLVAEAAHYTPRELARLGRKILEVIAPDLCEDQEAKALADEERRARETTSLHTKRLGDGSTRITAKVPDAVAARLRSYLEAFTSPRHHTSHHPGDLAGEGDRIPVHRKLGQAFCALLEVIDAKKMPLHGGDATTIIISIGLAELRQQLATAGIIGDGPITAAQARRLACTAALIPAVLGANSEILDLGRTRRLFSPAQRKAMALRDRHCRAEGCTIPAAWCEAHHAADPWASGGKTNLDDGQLLCNYHHHRAHDDRYLTQKLPNGDVRFRRRT